jgi:alpha-ketoglutarate-dependent 2,4-dichlorophenoxyacetate dioxygenase
VPEAARFPARPQRARAQRQFVYAHKWRLYDLVMWDNRQTMDGARPFRDTKEPRDMRRTIIKGEGPNAKQAGS